MRWLIRYLFSLAYADEIRKLKRIAADSILEGDDHERVTGMAIMFSLVSLKLDTEGVH